MYKWYISRYTVIKRYRSRISSSHLLQIKAKNRYWNLLVVLLWRHQPIRSSAPNRERIFFFFLLSLFHALSNARTTTTTTGRAVTPVGDALPAASWRHINRHGNDASRLPAVRRDEGVLRVAKERRWWRGTGVRRRVQPPPLHSRNARSATLTVTIGTVATIRTGLAL